MTRRLGGRRAVAFVAGLLSLAASPAVAQLATVPVVTGLAGAVAFVQDPLLPATYYIVQREGLVRVLQNGHLLAAPFLDLRDVVLAGGEQGLLGMAFAPDAATNRVFVNFTNGNGDTVVARFTRFAGQPRADAGTRFDLRWPDGRRFIEQPAANHNGGHLAFGPDGMLYIGLGDGGGGNDTYGNAQNPGTLLGKMLRIDVRVPDSNPKGYAVPPDNPFVGLPALGEIWAFGLRNPWRYSFDNPRLGGTGALVIGDVGQGAREEVDYQPYGAGGRNYGWPHREGRIATPGVTPPPPVPIPFSEPLFDYPRDVGATVTGGYVYRGGALPAAFRGRYFVADYAGKVASVGLALDPVTGEATATDVVEHTATLGDIGAISSFAEDLDGELYLVSLDLRRTVLKVVPAPGQVPGAPSGLTATLDGTAVTLAWSPGPGPAATAWRFTVGSRPGAADVLVTDLPATQTTVRIADVAAGVYYVSLQGVNAAGAGPRSNEARVDVACTPLPPPASTRYSRVGRLVTLQWNAVPGATGYRLTATAPPTGAVVATLGVGTVPGLTVAAPPGIYGVRVSAVGVCGLGAPSSLLVVDVPASGS